MQAWRPSRWLSGPRLESGTTRLGRRFPVSPASAPEQPLAVPASPASPDKPASAQPQQRPHEEWLDLLEQVMRRGDEAEISELLAEADRSGVDLDALEAELADRVADDDWAREAAASAEAEAARLADAAAAQEKARQRAAAARTRAAEEAMRRRTREAVQEAARRQAAEEARTRAAGDGRCTELLAPPSGRREMGMAGSGADESARLLAAIEVRKAALAGAGMRRAAEPVAMVEGGRASAAGESEQGRVAMHMQDSFVKEGVVVVVPPAEARETRGLAGGVRGAAAIVLRQEEADASDAEEGCEDDLGLEDEREWKVGAAGRPSRAGAEQQAGRSSEAVEGGGAGGAAHLVAGCGDHAPPAPPHTCACGARAGRQQQHARGAPSDPAGDAGITAGDGVGSEDRGTCVACQYERGGVGGANAFERCGPAGNCEYEMGAFGESRQYGRKMHVRSPSSSMLHSSSTGTLIRASASTAALAETPGFGARIAAGMGTGFAHGRTSPWPGWAGGVHIGEDLPPSRPILVTSPPPRLTRDTRRPSCFAEALDRPSRANRSLERSQQPHTHDTHDPPAAAFSHNPYTHTSHTPGSAAASYTSYPHTPHSLPALTAPHSHHHHPAADAHPRRASAPPPSAPAHTAQAGAVSTVAAAMQSALAAATVRAEHPPTPDVPKGETVAWEPKPARPAGRVRAYNPFPPTGEAVVPEAKAEPPVTISSRGQDPPRTAAGGTRCFGAPDAAREGPERGALHHRQSMRDEWRRKVEVLGGERRRQADEERDEAERRGEAEEHETRARAAEVEAAMRAAEEQAEQTAMAVEAEAAARCAAQQARRRERESRAAAETDRLRAAALLAEVARRDAEEMAEREHRVRAAEARRRTSERALAQAEEQAAAAAEAAVAAEEEAGFAARAALQAERQWAGWEIRTRARARAPKGLDSDQLDFVLEQTGEQCASALPAFERRLEQLRATTAGVEAGTGCAARREKIGHLDFLAGVMRERIALHRAA